jgi:hypothetical protein
MSDTTATNTSFLNYFETQAKRLVLFALAFAFSRFMFEAIDESTKQYMTKPWTYWVRASVFFAVTLAAVAFIAFVDPLNPGELP